MTGMTENAFINVKNVAPHDHGPCRAVGREDARRHHRPGRGLRRLDAVHEGRQSLTHEYNFFGVERTNIAGTTPVPAGKHEIRYDSFPTRRSPGRAARATLFVDGQKVAEGHIPKTQPYAFSADEGTDVGLDGETAVSRNYKQGDNAFTGKNRQGHRRREAAGDEPGRQEGRRGCGGRGGSDRGLGRFTRSVRNRRTSVRRPLAFRRWRT